MSLSFIFADIYREFILCCGFSGVGRGRVGVALGDFGRMLCADFLPFFFAFLEATDPISLIFVLAAMFTIFKLLEIFSSPDIILRYSSLLGGLICLGVTVSSFVLKSYLLTYEIASAIRNLVARSSDPSSVNLEYS